MEFFRIINKRVSESSIQDKINPQTIDKFTESMFFLADKSPNFSGATLWGEFLISYSKINGGIRFALVSCPNALTWTITTGFPPERDQIVLHCTINRVQKPAAFIEEINEFLDEWEAGLTTQF